MGKGGLSNALMGRVIRPQSGLQHVWDQQFIHHKGLPPVQQNAIVVAAWTVAEDGQSKVMVAARDDDGHVGEFYLTHVLIGEEP